MKFLFSVTTETEWKGITKVLIVLNDAGEIIILLGKISSENSKLFPSRILGEYCHEASDEIIIMIMSHSKARLVLKARSKKQKFINDLQVSLFSSTSC